MNIAIVSNVAWRNRIDEDQWLCDRLSTLGHTAEIAAWDDREQDWSGFDGAVLRSAWGYQHDMPRFLRWLELLKSAHVKLLNPPELLLENINKHRQFSYLQGKGLPMIPSHFFSSTHEELTTPEATLTATLEKHFPQSGQYVFKPIISASGHNTFLLDSAAVTDEQEAAFTQLCGNAETIGVMVQPFIPEVAQGELALVYFGGVYSHCVRRFTAVVTDHEKGAAEETPSLAAHALGMQAVAALGDSAPAYARIDMVETATGPILMEVELAEPFLFFDRLQQKQRETAISLFVDVILEQLI